MYYLTENDFYTNGDNNDLNLEQIIRELEGGDYSMDEPTEEPIDYEDENFSDPMIEGDYSQESEIDEIIEAILREEDEEETDDKEELVAELHDTKAELEEAYRTVKQMQSVIQEVNLLNAKLLYTNKLFRNFDLNEGQKMKVLENFDRAANTREVKLVFSTLAESFNKPTKKRVVKESYASKPVATTKPKTNTPILTEGFAQAERWKKLAGLL
jgi:Zn-dependent M32 family carboxypeptidase